MGAAGRAIAAVALIALAGCSYNQVRRALESHRGAMYEQRHQEHLRACERLLSEPARENCRSRAPPASFEEYERLRRSVPGNEKPDDELLPKPPPRSV